MASSDVLIAFGLWFRLTKLGWALALVHIVYAQLLRSIFIFWANDYGLWVLKLSEGPKWDIKVLITIASHFSSHFVPLCILLLISILSLIKHSIAKPKSWYPSEVKAGLWYQNMLSLFSGPLWQIQGHNLCGCCDDSATPGFISVYHEWNGIDGLRFP